MVKKEKRWGSFVSDPPQFGVRPSRSPRDFGEKGLAVGRRRKIILLHGTDYEKDAQKAVGKIA